MAVGAPTLAIIVTSYAPRAAHCWSKGMIWNDLKVLKSPIKNGVIKELYSNKITLSQGSLAVSVLRVTKPKT